MSLQKFKADLFQLSKDFQKEASYLKNRFIKGHWLLANLFLTNKCNLMCLDCPLWQEEPKDINLELSDLPLIVNICGGDPLLSKNIIDVLRQIKSQKRLILMTNNGLNYLHVDKKIFSYIDVPIVYMPGASREQLIENTGMDCYREYLALFDYFKEIKKRFVVQYPVSSINFEFIPELVQLLNPYKKALVWLKLPVNAQLLDSESKKYLWYNDQKKKVIVYEDQQKMIPPNTYCYGVVPGLENINIMNSYFILKLLAKLYF